jgi:hypothetical protein
VWPCFWRVIGFDWVGVHPPSNHIVVDGDIGSAMPMLVHKRAGDQSGAWPRNANRDAMLRRSCPFSLPMARRFAISFGPVCTVLALGLCVVDTAWADEESELARARSQFAQALSLEVAGDWGGALAKLEEVSRVRLTQQVRFHIGRCKAQLGRLTEALGDYRLAEHGETPIPVEDLEQIRRARQELEARIPRLLLVLSEGAVALRVELDGVEIGAVRLREPLLVDPGPRHIVVRGSDGQRFERMVMAVERQTTQVGLLPPGGTFPTSRVALTSEPAVRGATETPVWPYVVGGVGVAGIVGAGVFYYIRQDARQTLEEGCVNGICPERLRTVQQRGDRASTAMPIALAVGMLGLGIGGFGLLISDRSPEKQAAALPNWSIQLGERFLGVDVVGPF